MRHTLLSTVALLLCFHAVAQAEIKISAAGASFPGPLFTKWAEAYKLTHADTLIDYKTTGAGAGIKGITAKTIDFAALDAPLDEKKLKDGKLLQLPVAGGSLVMAYNIKGVSSLRITGDLLADMYLGKLTLWSDPKIAALNPGIKLPAEKINVVYKGGPSGLNYVFSDYLSKVSPAWKDKFGSATLSVSFPTGVEVKTGDVPATVLKKTENSIGYYEWAYAKKSKLAIATLVNAAGKDIPAGPAPVTSAALSAFKKDPDALLTSVTNADAPDAYPLSYFCFVLVHEDLSSITDKKEAEALVQFLSWCTSDAQDAISIVGFARLPREVQTKLQEKIKTIQYKGESLLK